MIEVSHLVKNYRDLKAVQDVSFEVKPGEILGFLGPNGAGKTTTMRILTGVIPPTSGSVKVCGFDVFEQPLEVKKRIGYLPENPPLYPEMTVRDYLAFVASIKGIASKTRRGEVERVAQKTNCDKFVDRVIGNLSKGQRQRVGLAQALLGDPQVLILDEPTVGLDPAQIIEVRELIKSLAGKHTIVLSTHILPEVTATCQRVLIIASGKIVANDDLAGLRHRYAGSSTADGQPGPAPSLEEIFLKLTSA
ncbi:MAG TPA: ABC transporter ATP-binding protein [Myxococcales bacterium]|nr:ABC transporter ATP-binding protein [Myxococcales bacterium]